ncbi:hypothetical protein [Salinithrix halophila]|uniref:Uncharacterized protein n=1 Tax=Salinithrix halophila TaxID=1485204 RepID=A0ABV8JA08_9BACL
MKRAVLLAVTLAIGSFPSVSSASEPVYNESEVLNPSNSTERVFKKVTRTVISDEEDVIRIEGEASEANEVEAYNIEVDEKAGTYTATNIEGEKLESFQEELQDKITARGSRYRSVTAITDDPAGVDLAKHTQKLNFSKGSSSVSYRSRSKSAWAAYPSSLGTHWYVDENKFTGLRFIDGNRTVESKSRAKFHNYDFGNDGKVTRVTHYITIEGYYTGKSRYYVDWARSGEGHTLLDLDIATKSG